MNEARSTENAPLTDDERETVIEWCHRWTCSHLADDYCGCSFDHLDRGMADRLIETVIERIIAARVAAAKAEAWDGGWDAGYSVGYEDAVNPDAPGMQRNNPYRYRSGEGRES